jgi:hypothetical protein
VTSTSDVPPALLNLIGNAADAMPTGGTLTVSTTIGENSSAVVLDICDDGIGIDPSIRERLFDPFVSTKRDGVGLGLVNAKAVVESHGGRLELTARVPKGTRARIVLPVSTAAYQESALCDILVVDDDESGERVREFSRLRGPYLPAREQRGRRDAVDCHTAAGARDDGYAQPGVDGLTRETDSKHIPDIYVVMMTSYGTSQTSIDAIRAGIRLPHQTAGPRGDSRRPQGD